MAYDIGTYRYGALKDLKDRFSFYLGDTLRCAPHTLGVEAEGVLATTGKVLAQPSAIHDQLADADLPYPEFTLPTGERSQRTQSGVRCVPGHVAQIRGYSRRDADYASDGRCIRRKGTQIRQRFVCRADSLEHAGWGLSHAGRPDQRGAAHAPPLSEDAQGAPARARFLNMLRAGGSDYPYELYKKAGIDMATPGPYQALVARMDHLMDEVEALERKQ